MFVTFFEELRDAKIPVTLREYLTLMEGLQADLASRRVEDFYYLARTTLVKDERHIDRFDQVFSHVFRGLEALSTEDLTTEIPEDWLRSVGAKYLSDEDKAKIEALGGWDKLIETLKERLKEQKGRHQGGSKWIGTGGTSPFGADGYNPEGIRIGQKESRHRRAVKVWDKREFKDFDDQIELGTRNMKLALRRLRQFARSGAADELDLDATIQGTAQQGYLDVRMRPERRNAVKVLMFLDVGGSMDWHVQTAEQLFSAARAEFKNLESFYFHNCLYEFVWTDNTRRWTERTPTWQILHKFPSDYKVIFVGDAAMSPYEVVVPGGSVEHMNAEAGQVWLQRVLDQFEHCIWLNPVSEDNWGWTQSTDLIRQQFANRMYPLTLDGLERGMRALMR